MVARFFCMGMLAFSFAAFGQRAPGKGELVIPPFEKKPVRRPAGPLKSKRMIFSEREVATARRNTARFPAAAQVRDSIVKSAAQWTGWTDERLYDLLTDARVPRAFDLNPKGCPVHGEEVYKKGGRYPWILDPEHPFKVKCPVGNEVYPANDYASYYKSDFRLPVDKSVPYADDGWGWLAPDGERYWFVAYANHWFWMNSIQSAIRDLSRSYLLTGEKQYAHKALVLLYRMAEVYPSMNHEDQSRYGLMSKAEGRLYQGKILNYIWECLLMQAVAEAYDLVWDAVDGDAELQRFLGKPGVEIRSFIEANLLEEAIDAYKARKILGNFGMHQMALLNVLLAREHPDLDSYIRELIDSPARDRSYTGINYTLYNQVFRDGLPLESPDYNMGWVTKLAEISETLRKGGTDLFADPRFRMLFDAPLEIVATGRYTPDWGDSGLTLGRIAGQLPDTYQIAYAATKDPAYLEWMAGIGKTGSSSFSTFGSLFREALPQTAPLPGGRSVREKPSRLFAGYGTGILNNPKDKTAVAFVYGMHLFHFHYDFLHFEVFANGQKMMPDLGYPDAANQYASSRYTWSRNTASHNTVVIDAVRQQQNLPGVLHDFSEGPFARSADASSPAYGSASQYRRNLIMVDADKDQSYIVDFFNVSGGRQHDYFLHGCPGSVTELTGTWGEVRPGTLAGETVPPGQIYDDPKLGKEGYAGSFASYTGSGYQHFFNVQKLEAGNSVTEFTHLRDAGAKLRIHLENLPGQAVFRADAYDKPRAKTNLLKYLVVRRQAAAGAAALKSTFVSVMEPFSAAPYIRSAKRLQLAAGAGQAVEIVRDKATDVVINDTLNTVKRLPAYGIETDANSVVLTFTPQKKLLRVFFSNGSYLKWGGRVFSNPEIKGTVTGVDARKSEVRVKLEENLPRGALRNQPPVAHFVNRYRSTVHPLAQVWPEGEKTLTLKIKDALLTGRVRVESMDGTTGRTLTNLPLEKTYNGVTLLDGAYKAVATVAKIEKGRLHLDPGSNVRIGAPADFWLANVGVGDTLMLRNSFSWEASEK